MPFPTQNTVDLTVTGSQDATTQHPATSDTDVIMVDGPDYPTRYLMVIDGKLQYQERDGHTYPMKTLPLAIMEWLRHECRDPEKKKGYFKWLMDNPLNYNEHGTLSTKEPFPPNPNLPVSKMRQILTAAYKFRDMVQRDREKHLEDAIWNDASFWNVRKRITIYQRLVRDSQQRNDTSSSRPSRADITNSKDLDC